jgi:cellulose synthase/poly-beta-1,6-N-acetylglucosamine synthase-like glycosyltransferase
MVMLLLLALLYAGLLVYYAHGWQRLPLLQRLETGLPKVSIIIAVRNEAGNIPSLIRSLQRQDYPDESIEILVADDHSTDSSASIAQSAGAMVVQIPETQSGKKAAIGAAIRLAKGDIIVTTDADCTMHPDWLRHLVAPFADDTVQIVAGPVVMGPGRGFLAAFQSIDMLGMQCLSGGAMARGRALLCNGANLAYRKSAFAQVGGFAGISRQASGDDVLLMLKLRKEWPDGLRFCKHPDAVVTTQPELTLHGLWHQRLRWVSKTSKMRTPNTAMLMGTAWLLHILLLLWMAGVWWMPELAWVPVTAFLLKIVPEWWCVHLAARQLRAPLPAIWLLPAQLVYIPYVAVVGFLGNFVRYRWKGRSLR